VAYIRLYQQAQRAWTMYCRFSIWCINASMNAYKQVFIGKNLHRTMMKHYNAVCFGSIGYSPSLYGTVQLQGNFRTRVRCTETCPGHVWDAHEMRPECAWDASMQAQNLTIKLQQDVREWYAPFFTRRRRIQDRSGMHANITLELYIYVYIALDATCTLIANRMVEGRGRGCW